MESLLIKALIIFLVAGVVTFLLRKAPFVDEPYKTYGSYIILVVVVLWILVAVAIPLIRSL